jgi:hypothetical protein
MLNISKLALPFVWLFLRPYRGPRSRALISRALVSVDLRSDGRAHVRSHSLDRIPLILPQKLRSRNLRKFELLDLSHQLAVSLTTASPLVEETLHSPKASHPPPQSSP